MSYNFASQLVLAHRIALLEVLEQVVSETIDKLTPTLGARLCKLGVDEMCKKQVCGGTGTGQRSPD